jgi:hypothetical protein
MTKFYKRFYTSAAMALIAIFTMSSASAYAIIDLSPKTSLNTNTNASINTNTSSSSGKVEINGSTKVDDDADQDEDSNRDDDNDGAKVEVENENSTDNDVNVINVNRAQIQNRGNSNENISETGAEHRATVLGPGDVENFGDLRAFAEARISKDDNLDEVNFTRDSVEVRYKQHGRFLALFSVPMKVKVTVNAEGDVKVRYPWYSFFTLDNQDQIEAQIKVAVDNALRGRMVGSVQSEGKADKPTLTPSELATLVDRIEAVLQAAFSADIELSQGASTTNSTSTQ